jgi:nucleotide-binding universal stress UspA family protein
MIVLKRILVATDFGEAAEAALNYGREFARTFGASLEVLHVGENVVARGLGAEGFTVDWSTLQRELEAAARKQLDDLLSAEDRATLDAKPVFVISNAPALAIVDHARESKADLILMGTHGRGAMAHLFMGSIAERVVRLAPCPVLTVRHPEREFVLPDALVAVAKA